MNPMLPPEVQSPAIPPVLEPVQITVGGALLTVSPGQITGAFHAIPFSLWQCILGFQRQVAILHSAESVTYHRWQEPDQCYHTLIPWQRTQKHGLSVTVNWKDPRNIELLDTYGRLHKIDFLPACTIHSHVDAGAFESGTDARDEEEAPGWHITLGKLVSSAKYDFDFRMRIPATKRLSARVDTGKGYKLQAKHLFTDDVNVALLHTIPGTLDWESFLERVIAH